MVVGSAVAFGITGNTAYVAEVLHDGADTGSHGSRYLAEKRNINQDTIKFKRFLKAGLLSVSMLSGYTAYRLGIEVKVGNIQHNSLNENLTNVFGATTIAVGNTYAFVQINSLEEHSNASEASLNHAQVDMVASWGLASSIVMETAGAEGASKWGGFLFAAYTAGHLALHAIKPHDAQ